MKHYGYPVEGLVCAIALNITGVASTASDKQIPIIIRGIRLATALEMSGNLAITPASLTIPFPGPVPVRIPTIKVRDSHENVLVTCIEILSLINKRNPGLNRYRQKRQRLHQANVHILEIDLLRRGQRSFGHPNLPRAAYVIALTRTKKSFVEVWPLKLQDTLTRRPSSSQES
ncbi:MAG: DUF4058 family protein [Cyanobacteria bacterium J06626_18]